MTVCHFAPIKQLMSDETLNHKHTETFFSNISWNKNRNMDEYYILNEFIQN